MKIRNLKDSKWRKNFIADFKAGEISEVPDSFGAEMIKYGYAEEVTETKVTEKKAITEYENKVIKPSENKSVKIVEKKRGRPKKR